LTLSDPVRRLALLAAALAVPCLGLAQASPPSPPSGDGRGPPAEVRERIERRLRLARTLGLAEALDLDEAGTARLNAALAPFDARRKAILEGVRGDVRTLRQAARKGDRVDAAAVDGAVQRLFDARAAMVALDREMFSTVSKGMAPEKTARMALFLAQFRQRFGAGMPDETPTGAR
jgi:hypothetical protein